MTQDTTEKPKVPMTTWKYVITIAAVINIAALAWIAYKSWGIGDGVDIKTNLVIMGMCLMNAILLFRMGCCKNETGKC